MFGFQPISTMRSPFRRSSTTSSSASSDRNSYASHASDSSTAHSINNVLLRQASVIDLQEERRSFASELNLLEPRPVVYFGSMEAQMGSF